MNTNEIPAWLQAARDAWQWRGASRPDFAQVPEPGQVAVWDFPRPPQPGEFYGGWMTPELVGPFKGAPGSLGL